MLLLFRNAGNTVLFEELSVLPEPILIQFLSTN